MKASVLALTPLSLAAQDVTVSPNRPRLAHTLTGPLHPAEEGYGSARGSAGTTIATALGNLFVGFPSTLGRFRRMAE